MGSEAGSGTIWYVIEVESLLSLLREPIAT